MAYHGYMHTHDNRSQETYKPVVIFQILGGPKGLKPSGGCINQLAEKGVYFEKTCAPDKMETMAFGMIQKHGSNQAFYL